MENNKISNFNSAERYEAEIKYNHKLSQKANELLLELGRNPNDYEPADYV